MVSLSIVIPALNAAETIRANLFSLLYNDFPKNCYEIMVVCDGSTDGLVKLPHNFQLKL